MENDENSKLMVQQKSLKSKVLNFENLKTINNLNP